MKNTYYCMSRKVGNRYISDAIKCDKGRNLFGLLNRYHDIVHVTPCETRKEAVDMAEYFNECYYNNGTYLYKEDNKVYPAMCLI